MKRSFIKCLSLFFFLAGLVPLRAQVPGWEWVTQSVNTLNSKVANSYTDNEGNTYVAGNFSGMLYIGDSSFQSLGAKDAFIAKYSQSGSVIWVNHFGGGRETVSISITADNAGNSYITGYFIDRQSQQFSATVMVI